MQNLSDTSNHVLSYYFLLVLEKIMRQGDLGTSSKAFEVYDCYLAQNTQLTFPPFIPIIK